MDDPVRGYDICLNNAGSVDPGSIISIDLDGISTGSLDETIFKVS